MSNIVFNRFVVHCGCGISYVQSQRSSIPPDRCAECFSTKIKVEVLEIQKGKESAEPCVHVESGDMSAWKRSGEVRWFAKSAKLGYPTILPPETTNCPFCGLLLPEVEP